MFKKCRLLLTSLALLLVSCGGGESSDQAELREMLGLTQHMAEGGTCKLMGNTDYPGIKVSDCLEGLECYHDLCQENSCHSDADCSSFGTNATCEAYVLDGTSHGNWCRGPQASSPGGGCDNDCLDNCTVGADCIYICC